MSKKATTPQKPKRDKELSYPEFWDTNRHSIHMLHSLLRDAKSPGEKFALRRVLRILHAICDETNPGA